MQEFNATTGVDAVSFLFFIPKPPRKGLSPPICNFIVLSACAEGKMKLII